MHKASVILMRLYHERHLDLRVVVSVYSLSGLVRLVSVLNGLHSFIIRLAIASTDFPVLSANSVLYIANSVQYSLPKRSARHDPSCCPHPQALDRTFVFQFDFKPIRTHVFIISCYFWHAVAQVCTELAQRAQMTVFRLDNLCSV
jgi:hypothetical protein